MGTQGEGAGERVPVSASPAHLRVLVVDDESSILAALIRYFGRQGWTADGIADAAAALDHLCHAPAGSYDAILTDLSMPGFDGAALHDALREARPDHFARLIIASGDLTSPAALALAERSPRPLIAKPFDFSSLLDLMRRVARGEA